MILILGAPWVAPIYIAANAAQENSAAGYAGVFYPNERGDSQWQRRTANDVGHMKHCTTDGEM